jgi:TPR repeat protein
MTCCALCGSAPHAIAGATDPPTSAPECEFRLEQFEPRSAAKTTLLARDAVIFYEALLQRNQAVPDPPFDRIVLRSGRDVLGGTVVLIARGDCVLGHGFLSGLDLIHATELVYLYANRASLQQDAHVELDKLRALADAADPVAQFHVGLTLALGWGQPRDRASGIRWLKRAAEQDYAPAMLALGMAFTGPGSLEDEVKFVGEPPRTDEFTDWVQACVWLTAAGQSGDPRVEAAARDEWEWRELGKLMTREQRTECKRQLRSRK